MASPAETPNVPFAYDEVAYPTPIRDDQTPDQLAKAALMHGFDPPDPRTASVLEIACGNGYNLIGVGAVAPASKCVGFDLSASAIAVGRKLVDDAGLTNVDLHQGDILTYPLDGDGFDYIICHGTHAWVPKPVQDALMKLIGARLAPGGVGYVTYDALPASAAKAAIIGFLGPRVAHIADPGARVEAAMALVATLARNQSDGSRLAEQLANLLQAAPGYEPAYFFHDWLSECYSPSAVADFAASAAAVGLAFLGDADMLDLHAADLDREAIALLDREGDDRAARNATMDILRGSHMFRRDLLIRKGAKTLQTDPLRQMSFAFLGSRAEVNTERGPAIRFAKGDHIAITVSGGEKQAVFDTLNHMAPAEIGFEALLAKSGASEEELRQALTNGLITDLIDAHVTPQPFVLDPGERPVAGRLVRTMLAQSSEAISLRHTNFSGKQEPTRLMLTLCDGTRTRAEIAAAMSQRYGTTIAPDVVNAAIRTLSASRLFES